MGLGLNGHLFDYFRRGFNVSTLLLFGYLEGVVNFLGHDVFCSLDQVFIGF